MKKRVIGNKIIISDVEIPDIIEAIIKYYMKKNKIKVKIKQCKK